MHPVIAASATTPAARHARAALGWTRRAGTAPASPGECAGPAVAGLTRACGPGPGHDSPLPAGLLVQCRTAARCRASTVLLPLAADMADVAHSQRQLKGNETAVKFPRRRTLVFAGAPVAALVVGGIAAKVALAPAHAGTASSADAGTATRAHGGTASPAPAPIVIDPSAGGRSRRHQRARQLP